MSERSLRLENIAAEPGIVSSERSLRLESVAAEPGTVSSERSLGSGSIAAEPGTVSSERSLGRGSITAELGIGSSEESLEVELIGVPVRPGFPREQEIAELCLLTAAAAGVAGSAHVAIEFVDSERISILNREHRGLDEPTDVLSFPIDGALAPSPGGPDQASLAGAPTSARTVPIELGDVIICPAHTYDIREAVVHGVLHLAGMDHERDGGEMLALQAELLANIAP